MKFEINLVFCVLVVLTGSSQTRGQSSALPPVLTLAAFPSHADFTASPDLTENPGNEVPQRTHNPTARDETSAETTTITKIEGTVYSETATNAVHTTHTTHTMHTTHTTHTLASSSAATPSQHVNVTVVMTAQPGTTSPSAAPNSLSSTPTVQSTTPLQHVSTTEGRSSLTTNPLTAFSSQDTNSTAHASTQPQSEALTTATTQATATTGRPLTSAPGRGPVGPTHQEVPSELNVGDEDFKPRYRSSSPLDPLLAGLLSVFIVTTAVVFVVLFLKFRQRTNHPEFHRLQDLPMDDLMEDTPLSRYTY